MALLFHLACLEWIRLRNPLAHFNASSMNFLRCSMSSKSLMRFMKEIGAEIVLE